MMYQATLFFFELAATFIVSLPPFVPFLVVFSCFYCLAEALLLP